MSHTAVSKCVSGHVGLGEGNVKQADQKPVTICGCPPTAPTTSFRAERLIQLGRKVPLLGGLNGHWWAIRGCSVSASLYWLECVTTTESGDQFQYLPATARRKVLRPGTKPGTCKWLTELEPPTVCLPIGDSAFSQTGKYQ